MMTESAAASAVGCDLLQSSVMMCDKETDILVTFTVAYMEFHVQHFFYTHIHTYTHTHVFTYIINMSPSYKMSSSGLKQVQHVTIPYTYKDTTPFEMLLLMLQHMIAAFYQ